MFIFLLLTSVLIGERFVPFKANLFFLETEYNINLQIFTWKRQLSLQRLCHSLLNAEYSGNYVDLTINIDGEYADEVLDYANSFDWPYGEKVIKCIVDSWLPNDNNEYAVFLEDDVEVSRYFYQWIKYCLYVSTSKNVVGCSLYTPRVNEILCPVNNPSVWLPSIEVGSYPFLFQLPSSWGAVYRGDAWKQFQEYYHSKDWKPVKELNSNLWKNSWKKGFIEFMIDRNLFLLYPNFPNEESFSTNYYEEGVHSWNDGDEIVIRNILRESHDWRFTVPLVDDDECFFELPLLFLPEKVNAFHQIIY